jgi:hypothetical protein
MKRREFITLLGGARAMREITGSAAAPAARCRKFRRGSFI